MPAQRPARPERPLHLAQYAPGSDALPDSALGLPADWVAFKRRYLARDGRVIDTGNGGISHSEGQSYGMLLAERLDDRASFNAMWRWTNRRLRRPNDALMAWRFNPHGVPVPDLNNAADGDLILAWALARGARRWGEAEMAQHAAAIGRDILTHCTVGYVDRTLLLPGAAGFTKADHVILNPSYFAFNAFRALSRLVPDNRWGMLETGALDILGASRFGRWGLPPDWTEVHPDGNLRPARGWPARFSWDAMRVPLHLAWAGIDAPALRAAVAFWTAPESPHRPPAWADLQSNATAPYAGHAGVQAVMDLAAWRLGAAGPPRHVPVASAPDYYAASLIMLSALAASEPPEPPALPASVTAPAARGGILGTISEMLGFGREAAP